MALADLIDYGLTVIATVKRTIDPERTNGQMVKAIHYPNVCSLVDVNAEGKIH